MITTLCFDFGNTLLKCAVFRDAAIEEIIVLENDHHSTIAQLISKYHPGKSLLSSVIHHDASIEEQLIRSSKFHLLSHLSKIPVTTPVGKPDTIGADRLAMVVAAAELFPGRNNLVIGMGSAITYNFVNKNKEFIGGGISPGVGMRFRSLHQFTAKLPMVKTDWNFPLMGYDTRTNILSGVILGTGKEIDGMIDLYQEKYGNLNVLLTGGDSAYFAPHIKNKIFADLNLIFKGLYAISELNNV
ncbi:MAG: type III pantothenate kinase [Flavitalea sp.]